MANNIRAESDESDDAEEENDDGDGDEGGRGREEGLHLVDGGGAGGNFDERARNGEGHVLDENATASVLKLNRLADESFLHRRGGGASRRRGRR